MAPTRAYRGQELSHQTVNGCNIRSRVMYASGTPRPREEPSFPRAPPETIPEELQSLIGDGAGVLMAERGVGQGLLQEGRVLELDPQGLLLGGLLSSGEDGHRESIGGARGLVTGVKNHVG